jgi:hypothetical protein
MKKTILTGLMMTLVFLSACGGGGGGGGNAPAVQYSKAVLTLSSSGTGTINGIVATVNLPAGVTVKASPSPVNSSVLDTDPGVVVASGPAAGANYVLATYVTTTTSSQVRIQVVSSGGFLAGEFAVVNCNIAAGYNPAAADFTITNQKAVDLGGASMPGITFGLTSLMQ